MKIKEVFRIGTVWAATLAIILPTTVFAGAPATTGQAVRDISLTTEGALVGRVVNTRGQATPNAAVTVLRDGQVAARTIADAQGQFVARGLTSGIYMVATGQQRQLCRVWTAATAPPIAARGIQLASEPVLRGQCTTSDCCSGCDDTGCAGGCSDSCSDCCVAGDGCTGSLGCGGGGMLGGGLLGSPALVAVGIAAAVAIPVALDDDDDEPAASVTPMTP